MGWAGACSSRVAQSSVIVFDVCEVATKSNVSKGEGRMPDTFC